MSLNHPQLSVIIPTWNRSGLVCEAIESALAQRPGEVEVIVVDDASADDTAQVVMRRFGSRVRLLRKGLRGGAAAGRNAGVRLANGELVAFLDSDDLWLPGKLDAELEVLEEFPVADGVISDNIHFKEGKVSERTRFEKNGLLAASGGQVCWMRDYPRIWTSLSPVSTCSMTLRRGVLSRLGECLFAEDIVSHEDWEMEIRVFHMCSIAVLPKVWSHVREYDDGTRIGRVPSGRARNRTQEIEHLRGRLTVLERSLGLQGLDRKVVNGLERSRIETVRQLDQYEALEGDAENGHR